MKHVITDTSNGIPVYVDLIHSQAAEHISSQPNLLGLVKEVLQQTTAKGDHVDIETDMGRGIGYSYVVTTSEKDSIVYAQLMRDDTYTRFVKNGTPLTTQFLSIQLRRAEDGSYELHDTWVGPLTPPHPGSSDETSESKPYWADHAVVLGNQRLQVRSATKVCPY
jgi:hypothetical protein